MSYPPVQSEFVHLHVHTHYSLLNALPTPKELVALAKADGQDALAITDNGALYGAIDFYKACTKEAIRPIIGLDAYLAPRTRHDRDGNLDKPRARLVLLAKTFAGYQNLIKLVTRSNLEGFYYRPRLDQELLAELKDDLVCIIPSFAGEVARAYKDQASERAAERLDWYKQTFGEDCYLEISHHPEILDHQSIQEQIKDLANETSTPIVAAHDVYYCQPEDRVARETMVKIQNGGVVDTASDHTQSEDFSFKTQAQMQKYFSDTPEALQNTIKIANTCSVEINIGTHWYFPDYIIESGRDPDEELRVTAYAGLTWRELDPTDTTTTERLDYELNIIKTKGYAKYFLVVGDLLREARERGILTTIRGSVAGSLTTYVLGITNVNPLEYKLPFERFLNPERPSAPDIDMDFADNRRDEIIEYSKEKYGADKVAQIGTFGTMMARAAVRDVARALGHPYSTGDRIAKLIPMGSQGFPMTIEKALEIEPDLKDLYKKDSESREVIDLARQIEGRVRHLGVHAAGVVIAPEPLDQFVPIQSDPKSGKYITQYEMHSVGEDGVGLLKFDFLGIKNLAILADAVKRVEENYGTTIDIEDIPLDDQATFDILARGETMGLFQLNGTGMTAFLKQLKPTSIHDINAMVALYRPGPMESIPTYIERKHNAALVTYLDPRLEKILDLSYGVITYQDDVMAISRELAGYSWLEADMLRKAMGKKIPEVMAAEKDKLLTGFVEHGQLSEKLAEQLWTLIEPFAAYGFNKCLPASARIVDATSGIPTTIESLLTRRKKPSVFALGNDHKIVTKTASRPFTNGVKTVYRLTTRSGRVIRATGNHPLRTWHGWIHLTNIKPKERLAVPRYVPAPRHTKPLAKHKAAALGYLLSEGNLCHPHGVYFYSTQENELQDFIRSARSFDGATITIDRSKSAASVYVGGTPNTMMCWLKKLGLHTKRAVEKFVPDIVFTADNNSIALFLGKLWQGDGCVSTKNQQTYYATSSERLANDVQHLLLRLGVLSTIHSKIFKYRGEERLGWTVVVSSTDNLQTFAKTAGKHLIGQKRVALKELVTKSKVRTNTLGRGTPDTVPTEVLLLIREEMQKRGHTPKTMARMTGLSERLFAKDVRKRGYTRDVLEKIGVALASPEIIAHATSDIFWDEVKSIEKEGKEMTYDVSVPGPENFIADNFFVHNSHAASYGRVAYQTAYMKANYPHEYMAAVLTADSGDTDKVAEIIHECDRMGIEVLPPDINESFSEFTVVYDSTDTDKTANSSSDFSQTAGGQGAVDNTTQGPEREERGMPGDTEQRSETDNSSSDFSQTAGGQGAVEKHTEAYTKYDKGVSQTATQSSRRTEENAARIRFGLTTIKNFGAGIAAAIITEREANGPFTSLTDLLLRIHDKNLNKKSLEALIMTGALDRFGERGAMYEAIDMLLAFNREHASGKEAAQDSLFAGIDDSVQSVELPPCEPATMAQKLLWEKELLGVYVSGHPLDAVVAEVEKRPRIGAILQDGRNGIPVVTTGIIESVRELLTKKGDRMAFIRLADQKDAIEITAFPETYSSYREVLQAGTCVAVKGRLSIRNDEPGILIERVKTLASEAEPVSSKESAQQLTA